MLIDTHVHINFDVYQDELDTLRSHWIEAGVVNLVHSCVHPSEFSKTQAIAQRFPEVYLSIGLHPLDADKWIDNLGDDIIEKAKSEPKVVAIGETGLDFYKATNYEWQKEVFTQQLKIAHQLNLPVIIHCRDAAKEMYELLKDFWQNVGIVSGVMHCWSGNITETKWFLELGLYISMSGVVTFKNAKEIQETAKIIPSDRLLIETDCPFLAPVPKRGKRNEPAFVKYVAEFVANLREETPENLGNQTTENARRLFKISNN